MEGWQSDGQGNRGDGEVFPIDVDTVAGLAGIAGAVIYVAAYFALQTGLMRGATIPYTLLNVAAATLVLISLSRAFNIGAALIQIAWLTISFIGLARVAFLHRTARLDADEAAVAAARFPRMDRPTARRFFRAGLWQEGDAGTRLATEGEDLGALILLARGRGEVSLGGRRVGQVGPGDMIGDMTCFDGGPANATVALTEPGRWFAISSAVLQRLCRRDPELHRQVAEAIARQTRTRLIAANRR